MLRPKLLEAWFTLMAEAAKGTAEAQEGGAVKQTHAADGRVSS